MANVLIVDDSSTMRKIISRSLRQAGLAVDDIFEAGDGIEGLSVLGEKSVDLIKQVRGNGNSVPIVMITTEGGEDIIKEALASGASASIKKPFTPDQLNEKLGGLI
jgi:two-component system chemotaxis response regulator CheY